MSNDLPTVIELWPLAADQAAIWLLSGEEPLTTGAVQSDVGKYATAEQTAQWFLQAPPKVLHQTSARDARNVGIETWIAVPALDGPIVDHFPNAEPVTAELLEVVGRPFPHAGAQAPLNRRVDILQHALRHVAWLVGTQGDANVRAELGPWWVEHLRAVEPALATLYTGLYQPTVERLTA